MLEFVPLIHDVPNNGDPRVVHEVAPSLADAIEPLPAPTTGAVEAQWGASDSPTALGCTS
jgi:hypothetical protein